MVKKRVYEVAKELGISSKELATILTRMGVAIKSHMSTVEDEQQVRVQAYLAEKKRQAAPAPLTGKTPVAVDKPAGIILLNSSQNGRPTLPESGSGRLPQVARPLAPGKPIPTDRPTGKNPATPALRTNTQRPAAGQERTGQPPEKPRPGNVYSGRPGEGRATVPPQAARGANQRANQGQYGPARYPQRQPGTPAAPVNVQRDLRPGAGVAGKPQSAPPRFQDNRPRPTPSGAGRSFAEMNSGRNSVEKTGALAPSTTTRRDRPSYSGQRPAIGKPAPGAPLAPKGKDHPTISGKATGKQGKPPQRQGGLSRDTWKNQRAFLGIQEEERLARKQKGRAKTKVLTPAPAPPVKKILLGDSLTVAELARKMARKPAVVIKTLLNLGVLATLNQELDVETASLVAGELGMEAEIKLVTPATEILDVEDPEESLVERSPVVTVMGHVDHGKTSLLDAIRKENVTATEVGGITQHIGAYQVEAGNRKITFLDTPGHEAFTAMRARGAKVTDIAVLVVAADDGAMPQTIEAINHAKAAGVSVLVAINKIDKPQANPEKVKQQLAEHGLIAEGWGGDTIFVQVSAVTRQGLDELLEMILLLADTLELRANSSRDAKGVVIEAKLDKGRGPVSTVLVQKGTLKVGDNLVLGKTSGRIRAMTNDRGDRINWAGPSQPVEIIGLNDVPEAGDVFQVVTEERFARGVANARQLQYKKTLIKDTRPNAQELFKQLASQTAKDFNVIIKADVQGSVQAINQALERLSTPEVRVNIIHAAVGAIRETDVMLAKASGALVIGFNVRPDTNAKKAAEIEAIEIRLYRIIYEVIDEVRLAMSGLLEPEFREQILGKAEVRQTFYVPKAGLVAGSYIIEGKLLNHAKARVVRDGNVVYEGQVLSLRRFKDDVHEVAQGYECGIGLERFNDIKKGDVIEAFTLEEVHRQL